MKTKLSHPHINVTHSALALAGAILLSLTLLITTARTQDLDVATKLRLAQSLEQSGEWERAAGIYESLLENNPQSFVALEGLRRAYTELKEYDKAMDLVRQQLRTMPNDENLLTALGGLYDLAGQAQKADSLWHVVIGKEPTNPNLYRLVASQLMEHREYDKAIQIYLEGRNATKNQTLFLEELAALYGALHQFEAATREYVKLVRLNPQQVSYVQARLASFTSREEGRTAAVEVVRREMEQNPDEVPLHSILAWLFMEGKEYDSALNQYRIMDKLTRADGNELFQFGQRCAAEKVYLVSAKAFREAIGQNTSRSLVPQARLGYARAIEELSAENDTMAQSSFPAATAPSGNAPGARVTETEPTFQGALGLYESIMADYPNTEPAMQALFRIGTIRFNRFFDLNGAAPAFEGVRKMTFNPNLAQEATINLAEIETARNDLARAREDYTQLARTAAEPNRDRMVFRLAELDYFEASFDSACTKLQKISENVNHDLTNDALILLYFIQENRGAGQPALTDFAHADLLVRQRKYSEALAGFQSVVSHYGTTTLADDAMMRTGEMQLLLNHISEALEVFRKVANDMPTSILRDHAQMRIAEVYERRLKDKQKAIEAYEQLLANYPASLFVEEARKRIRILRGDSI